MKIDARIKKAKSIMGFSKHFFDNKDVDHRLQYHAYTSGALNDFLWDSKDWNLRKKNLNKLQSFHHSAIRFIVNFKCHQVRKCIYRIEVRAMFYNIPNVDVFINKRVAKYIGKIARSKDITSPKKVLAAWINKARKIRGHQLTCNNNFARVIMDILPAEFALTNSKAPIKEWFSIAKDESN